MEKNIGEEIGRMTDFLQSQIKDINVKSSCTPTLMVIGVFTPFVLWLLFYFLAPSLVMNTEGSRKVMSGKKLVMWTIVFTVLVWGLLYGYSYYTGYGASSEVCLV